MKYACLLGFRSWRIFSDVYIFDPKEGGLIRGVGDLARDCSMDLGLRRLFHILVSIRI
jgi:hypothetical protein